MISVENTLPYKYLSAVHTNKIAISQHCTEHEEEKRFAVGYIKGTRTLC